MATSSRPRSTGLARCATQSWSSEHPAVGSRAVESPPIYVSRLLRLALLDADGMAVGKLDDVVITPSAPGSAPRVLGFVALMQRRRIFVNGNQVEEISASGV